MPKNPNITRTQVFADMLLKAVNPIAAKAVKARKAKMAKIHKTLNTPKKKKVRR